jgi:hypothetical protein
VGPGDDHRCPVAKEEVFQHFGHRYVVETPLENGLELRVSPGERVSHHHQVDGLGTIRGRVGGADLDSELSQKGDISG